MNIRSIFPPTIAFITAAFGGPVEDAETLLQRQKFKEAGAALTDPALAQAPEKGYARYLRALALTESKQFAAAITDCDAVPPTDVWHRKALFLKAQCLAELKRHKEAEEIYSAESTRQFATERQEKLAGVLVSLARELVKPAAPGQTVADDARSKALNLYRKATDLESSPAFRETLLFETAELLRLASNEGALKDGCEAYLAEFDPDWKSPDTNAKSKSALVGSHRWAVRAMLIESSLRTGDGTRAKAMGAEVLALWKTKPLPVASRPDEGDIEWMICRASGTLQRPPQLQLNISNTFNQQQGLPTRESPRIASDPARYIEAIRGFLKRFPNHQRAAEAARTLVEALESHGKKDDAIAACKVVYTRADWPAPAPQQGDVRTPAERLDAWRQEAFYKEAELEFAMRRYRKATDQWRAYIARHPDGGLWQKAQSAIIDTEFQLCLEAVAASQQEAAAKQFEAFIAAHPLDTRCAQLLFLNGQWHYAAAQALDKAAAGKPRTKELIVSHDRAIAEWAKLIAKHPRSDEASLALYTTGVIQSDVLGRFEEALATFQRVNWGASKAQATSRAASMTQKSLALRTPRVFRSNEPAHVRVDTRNIENLKVSRYTLNLEDYFRSRHRLDGEGGIGSLDIDLIQPDKTWEVPVAEYAPLKPVEQEIAVPFDGAKPGVCVVRVEGDDWQSSTIAVRSDLDVIVQSAWTEALIFVQNRVKGAVVADAEVLVSNGKEIIGQGRTGADGVFRLKGEMIRAAAELCVYVRTPAGEAIQRLDLRGMTQEITDGKTDRESVTPAQQGFIYPDKPTYEPGETVHFRGVIRDVENGAYVVPVGREYEVRVQDDERRVLRKMKVKLGEFGTFSESVPFPAGTPLGSYRIAVQSVEGDEAYGADFSVVESVQDEVSAVVEIKPEPVVRGDRIDGVVRLRYAWGLPVAGEALVVTMPDGRKLDGKSDAAGAYAFTQETSGFPAGKFMIVGVAIKGRNIFFPLAVNTVETGTRLAWERVPAPALSGEAAMIRVKALTHKGQAIATQVKLSIALKPEQKPNAVLSGLPGLAYIPAVAEPVQVEELTLQTDPVTGIAEARPVLKNAAIHIVTARATDARGNVADISTEIQVSGADDPQKLRIFSDIVAVSEGAALKVDAHSRVAAPLALVTFAGESILEHRVVALAAGHNDVAVTVGNAHWPQFDVSVLYLDGDKLQRARCGFVVKRPLSIELETPAVAPEAGAEIDIVVTTKDGLGEPIAAELSMAMASSGLHSEQDGSLEATFAENLRERGSIRTSASAGSGHRGESQIIVKDVAETPATTVSAANLNVQQNGGQFRQTIQGNGLQIGANTFNQQVFVQNGGGLEFTPSQIAQVGQNEEAVQGDSSVHKSTRAVAKAALWQSAVVTDAAGKATIKVRVPSGAGEWRLFARGCTKGSAFGQASKTLTTKGAPMNQAKNVPVAASADYDADLRNSGMIFTKPGALDFAAMERQRTVFTIHDSPSSLLRTIGLGLSDSADGRARTPQTASSQLLAAVAALRAIRADGKNDTALAERISLLISALQITQRDGGWTWEDVKWTRDSVVTSLGLWTLVEARALGFAVEDATVNSAAVFLKSALAIIPPDEPEKAAVILHALALMNQADFSVANRLLRDRAKLNDPALAHLAAAFLRMERPQEAQELLKALEARPEWAGSSGTGRLSRADDTIAIILYAAARAQAGSPLAKKAADALVAKLGVSCAADSPLRGLTAAALAEHFIGSGLHRIALAHKLELSVDGKGMNAPFQSGNGNAAQRADVAFADGKGMPILLATSVARGVAPVNPVGSLPVVVRREWLHEGMRHNDLPLKAASTSPVAIATLGQRVRVKLTLRGPQSNQSSYVTLDEPLPAGCHLRAETVSSKAVRVEEIPGRIRLWFTPGTFRPAAEVVISYELIALHPGDFTIPPTIVRDACRTLRQPAGPAGKLTILEAEKPSAEPYQINRGERLELAKLLFDSGRFEEARAHLDILRGDAAAMRENEREIARMLLWAHTARAPMESKQVVELFETLSERHPDIVIPFDRILKVGEAYRQIGEFERACLVYRATLEGGFVRDARVSAALEANGDFPASVEHKLALWQEYPDVPDVSLAYFSLAQSLQDKSAEPGAVPVRPGALKLTKTQLLERSRDLLRRFVTLRAKDELADDASFSLANVFFDLKDYASVVKTAGMAAAAYAKSPFANSFLYMTALGHFWQYQFPEALAAAAPVAAGTSTDAPNARYITAQTYHAQGRPAEAIKWYEKVKDEFDDAEESISVLQEKGVKLPPATSIKPGQPVKLELDYRNVKDAALKIYRVDLMKLHERQKDLSEVSAVNLAGITPEAEMSVALGDGLDYAWKKRAVELPMKAEGAYLVICRGDSQMTSALMLITTLDMEINEDSEIGNVRVQVRDTVSGSYVADADIATYDSASTAEPQKGRTDPRGAFSASGIEGYATIVVKLGDTRYAYHRSATHLTKTPIVKTPAPNAAPAQPAPKQMSKGDYLNNVKELNRFNNEGNLMIWEKKMKSDGQGVKAEKAFKK